MIAQGSCIGIAVLHQPAARRQVREHRALDIGDRVQQLDGFWAIGKRGWQRRAIPLEVKALPSRAEERIETPVVVFVGGLDRALREQLQRLLADRLPIVAQYGE